MQKLQPCAKIEIIQIYAVQSGGWRIAIQAPPSLCYMEPIFSITINENVQYENVGYNQENNYVQ